MVEVSEVWGVAILHDGAQGVGLTLWHLSGSHYGVCLRGWGS